MLLRLPAASCPPLSSALARADDCSVLCKMEEPRRSRKSAPNGEAGRPQDASPRGAGPWRHHDVTVVGGKDKKGGEQATSTGHRPAALAAPAAERMHNKSCTAVTKQKTVTSAKRLPVAKLPVVVPLCCRSQNHLPSINWETKLGKPFCFCGFLRPPVPLFPARLHALMTAVFYVKWKNPGGAGRAHQTAKPAGPRTRARRPNRG